MNTVIEIIISMHNYVNDFTERWVELALNDPYPEKHLFVLAAIASIAICFMSIKKTIVGRK